MATQFFYDIDNYINNSYDNEESKLDLKPGFTGEDTNECFLVQTNEHRFYLSELFSTVEIFKDKVTYIRKNESGDTIEEIKDYLKNQKNIFIFRNLLSKDLDDPKEEKPFNKYMITSEKNNIYFRDFDLEGYENAVLEINKDDTIESKKQKLYDELSASPIGKSIFDEDQYAYLVFVTEEGKGIVALVYKGTDGTWYFQ